jgi:hypothetical protein
MRRCGVCGLFHRAGLCNPNNGWDYRARVEVSSVAQDQDRIGVGSSGYPGDIAADGIRIPTAPTIAFVNGLDPPHVVQIAQQNRYLFRLCGFAVPPNYWCRILGIRTIITIGIDLIVDQTVGGVASHSVFTIEKPVTTPFWTFQNGNVSFHLRYSPWASGSIVTMPYAADRPLGGSTTYDGSTEAALLFVPPSTPYHAPMGGMPPGVGVGSLGTWRDPTRFPWNAQSPASDMDVDVGMGPGIVSLWASVYQTDPTTRTTYPKLGEGNLTPEQVIVLTQSPEDAFLLAYPLSFYKRVAGALIGEIIPSGPMLGRNDLQPNDTGDDR